MSYLIDICKPPHQYTWVTSSISVSHLIDIWWIITSPKQCIDWHQTSSSLTCINVVKGKIAVVILMRSSSYESRIFLSLSIDGWICRGERYFRFDLRYEEVNVCSMSYWELNFFVVAISKYFVTLVCRGKYFYSEFRHIQDFWSYQN